MIGDGRTDGRTGGAFDQGWQVGYIIKSVGPGFEINGLISVWTVAASFIKKL